MRAVAEFVMRGKLHALAVTVAGAGSLMFCWISAAVIALVTLRKGAGPGLWLLFWALLPAGALLFLYGDSGPLTLLISTAILAVVLRETVSLPMTVLATVPLGLLTGAALLVFGGAFLEQMVGFFTQFLGSLEQQLSAQGDTAVQLAVPTASQIAGMLAAANAMVALLSLLLARWWQASLYNPGGFAQEFRALSLSQTAALGLSLLALLLFALGPTYRSWAAVFMVPLSVVGIALVHARVAVRKQGSGWLVAFYLLWLLLDPVKFVVAAVAVADSWMNFRQRWQGRVVVKKDDDRNDDSGAD